MILFSHRFDPQFLGPAVEYDSFPPFPEKPIPEKDLPYALLLNKKEYYAYHEATPHDNWFCEYPYCSTTFIPYLVWGTRHHCRSCGISVCCDHSTPNITLSSHILSIYHGDLAAVETPILATSMDESTLPSVVTLKYACLLCSEKALPRTGKEVKATKKASKPIKGTTVFVVFVVHRVKSQFLMNVQSNVAN